MKIDVIMIYAYADIYIYKESLRKQQKGITYKSRRVIVSDRFGVSKCLLLEIEYNSCK